MDTSKDAFRLVQQIADEQGIGIDVEIISQIASLCGLNESCIRSQVKAYDPKQKIEIKKKPSRIPNYRKGPKPC